MIDYLKWLTYFLLLKACASLEEDYMPPVTFVVVQKRHHTRLFPANYSNRNEMDPSSNILPGVCLFSKFNASFLYLLCMKYNLSDTFV